MKQNYASDLEDAESLARAMVDDTADSLEHFISNIEQHMFQIEAYSKDARALTQLKVAGKKAEVLLNYLNEILETLGKKKVS